MLTEVIFFNVLGLTLLVVTHRIQSG